MAACISILAARSSSSPSLTYPTWSSGARRARFADWTAKAQTAAAIPGTVPRSAPLSCAEVRVNPRLAPSLRDAIDTARAAGDGHIGLDGTLISTTRAQVEGPTKGVDLFWSGTHHRHGVNLQVISAPDGYPLWVAEARPGREHDANAAGKTGIEAEIALLDIGVSDEEYLLVLVDLGMRSSGPSQLWWRCTRPPRAASSPRPRRSGTVSSAPSAPRPRRPTPI